MHFTGTAQECTVSGTLVALSHSIRLRPGAHTGAECVLRATYQSNGNRRETVEGQNGERVTDKRQQGHRRGDITNTKKQKGRAGAKVNERRLDLESS